MSRCPRWKQCSSAGDSASPVRRSEHASRDWAPPHGSTSHQTRHGHEDRSPNLVRHEGPALHAPCCSVHRRAGFDSCEKPGRHDDARSQESSEHQLLRSRRTDVNSNNIASTKTQAAPISLSLYLAPHPIDSRARPFTCAGSGATAFCCAQSAGISHDAGLLQRVTCGPPLRD